MGRPDIYLQPFPGPGSKIRVSPDGGTQVRWRGDGKELFYVDPQRRLVAVAISEGLGGELRPGLPVTLFSSQVLTPSAIFRQQYDVTRNSQRFVIITGDEAATPPISLILNWNPGRSAFTRGPILTRCRCRYPHTDDFFAQLVS